ncbi:MAG: glycine zipper family protein, partial [Rouxiella aceris]|nr:glycine zipper family protein [Rouxiella aceris]
MLPAQGKPFTQFQAEDANCRKWAEQSIGISPQEAQNQSTVSGAAIGTLGGAGVGALLGSASGHAGAGAA